MKTAALAQPLSGLTDHDLLPREVCGPKTTVYRGLQPLHGEAEEMNSVGKKVS